MTVIISILREGERRFVSIGKKYLLYRKLVFFQVSVFTFWRIEGCLVPAGNRRTLLCRPARSLFAIPATMCRFLIHICILMLDHKVYLRQEAREFN